MACLFRSPVALPLEGRHVCRRLVPILRSRSLNTATPVKMYDAVVVGAGPGGLTAASNLLDQGLKICMIDPYFTAGRISEKYREVPSNTRVKMFAQWATGTQAFSKVIEAAPEGNPYEKMMNFDQERGCQLGDAIDVAQMLSDGLRSDERVDILKGKVLKVVRFGGLWLFPGHEIAANKVVLAQGSHPRKSPEWMRDKRSPASKSLSHLKEIPLDTCLKPSELKTIVSAGSVLGVIGSSHSAVLAMKNLYEIEGVKIVNFYRSPLLYAEYKDDWILYDNTGLKGIAADWAREILENPPDPERLKRVNAKDYMAQRNVDEAKMYSIELRECTHLVAAIGYVNNKVPSISGAKIGAAIPEFDPHTGKFKSPSTGEAVPGLYGAGIAYPETVTDKVGNVESAVGWFKFMKFMKRVVPEWTKSS